MSAISLEPAIRCDRFDSVQLDGVVYGCITSQGTVHAVNVSSNDSFTCGGQLQYLCDGPVHHGDGQVNFIKSLVSKIDSPCFRALQAEPAD